MFLFSRKLEQFRTTIHCKWADMAPAGIGERPQLPARSSLHPAAPRSLPAFRDPPRGLGPPSPGIQNPHEPPHTGAPRRTSARCGRRKRKERGEPRRAPPLPQAPPPFGNLRSASGISAPRSCLSAGTRKFLSVFADRGVPSEISGFFRDFPAFFGSLRRRLRAEFSSPFGSRVGGYGKGRET